MSPKTSLIEINGQLYDANSGRLFHHPRGPVIDGFVRKAQPSRVIKKVTASFSPVSHKAASKNRGLKPAHSVHSRAQRSQTLKRAAVNRPHKIKETSAKQPLKANNPSVSKARFSKAMNIVKNSRVKRFGTAPSIQKPAQPIAHSKPSLRTNGNVLANNAASAAVVAAPPSLVSSMSHQRLERMLDEALIKADAHKKALNERLGGKRRISKRLNFLPKWLTISLVALVVLSVGGYFAWSKVPYLSMKVASLRAHVQGSLPEYIPSGFKFAGANGSQSGTLSMTYIGEGERTFTLEQQASKMNSSSLEDSGLPSDAQIQTMQVKGTTIYIDSTKNEASWVNNGTLHKIKGDLDANEISRIANSIF